MLTLNDLIPYFEEADDNKIGFSGKCHDCGNKIQVDVDVDEEGKVTVSGGAIYRPDIGTEKVFFLKCDDCYSEDPVLRNYFPCEVYSRVVGYLRPVKQWNEAKKVEFRKRKNFKMEE